MKEVKEIKAVNDVIRLFQSQGDLYLSEAQAIKLTQLILDNPTFPEKPLPEIMRLVVKSMIESPELLTKLQTSALKPLTALLSTIDKWLNDYKDEIAMTLASNVDEEHNGDKNVA